MLTASSYEALCASQRLKARKSGNHNKFGVFASSEAISVGDRSDSSNEFKIDVKHVNVLFERTKIM